MNFKNAATLFGLVFAGAGTMAYLIVDSKMRDKKEMSWIRHCGNTVKKEMDPADKVIIDAEITARNDVETIQAKEIAARNVEFEKWANESGYHDTIRNAKEEYSKAVDEWLKENNYAARLREAETEKASKISDYISSSGYKTKIESLKGQIEAAKKKYKSEKNIAEALGKVDEHLSDGAEEMEKSAKKAMDTAVKECKDKIREIEKEKEDYVRSVESEYTATVTDLKSQFREFKVEAAARRNKIYDECENKREDVFRQIIKRQEENRSEEDKETMKKADMLREQVKMIKTKTQIKCGKMFKNGNKVKRLACSYASDGWGWKAYLFAASMPVVVCGIAICNYVSYIWKVAMCIKNDFSAAEV